MAFSATVIPVMIASPSDVRKFRMIVRDVLHAWNDVHSEHSQLVLMPVGWDTHSSPELGASPQELINNRVLEDCDLLIGIFWTRLGTPTAAAASGTVEEIQRHVNAGKPAMVYFSEQPVALGNVEMGQYEALKQFRAWCEEQGLVEKFSSEADLRDKLARQVQITLQRNPYLAEIVVASSAVVVSAQVRASASLSPEAKELLVAAAGDEQGVIISVNAIDGQYITVGAKSFGDSRDRRVMAKWQNAIEELVDSGLVRQEDGGSASIFRVIESGYQFAEELKKKQVYRR